MISFFDLAGVQENLEVILQVMLVMGISQIRQLVYLEDKNCLARNLVSHSLISISSNIPF